MLIRILKSMFSAAKEEYEKISNEKEQNRLYKIWSTKWSNDLEWINHQIDSDKSEHSDFKWAQLVMQEGKMWACVAKKFTMKEIDNLVEGRKFNEIQKQYLIDHANNMGLLISEEEMTEIKRKIQEEDEKKYGKKFEAVYE